MRYEATIQKLRCLTPEQRAEKRKEFEYELIGNGVEMRVGRVVARAVRRGLELLERPD